MGVYRMTLGLLPRNTPDAGEAAACDLCALVLIVLESVATGAVTLL